MGVSVQQYRGQADDSLVRTGVGARRCSVVKKASSKRGACTANGSDSGHIPLITTTAGFLRRQCSRQAFSALRRTQTRRRIGRDSGHFNKDGIQIELLTDLLTIFSQKISFFQKHLRVQSTLSKVHFPEVNLRYLPT